MLRIHTIPKLNECKFKVKKLLYKFVKQPSEHEIFWRS